MPDWRRIFFCHPGYIDEILKEKDSLVEERINNSNFLKSNEFIELLAFNKVKLNRYQF